MSFEDLLRAPDVEERDEPAASGPSGPEAPVASERGEVPVGPVEPEQEEDSGRDEHGAVDQRDEQLAAVVIVRLRRRDELALLNVVEQRPLHQPGHDAGDGRADADDQEDRDDLRASSERPVGLAVRERRFVQLDPFVRRADPNSVVGPIPSGAGSSLL
jgi:hypothetical protein